MKLRYSIGINMSSIVLHQWEISPYCTKVRLALDYKSIPFKVVNYNGLKAMQVKKLSPAGKLPVLEIDGELIQDSKDIIKRLDQEFPDKKIISDNELVNARAEILQNWVDTTVIAHEIFLRSFYPEALDKMLSSMCEGRTKLEKTLLKPYVKHMLQKTSKRNGLHENNKAAIEKEFLDLLKQVDLTLAEQEFIAGDTISIADFALAGQLNEVLRTSHLRNQLLQMPNLGPWLSRMGCESS